MDDRRRLLLDLGPFSTPSCYRVRREGETLLWVAPGSGKSYPSTVLPGRQLVP